MQALKYNKLIFTSKLVTLFLFLIIGLTITAQQATTYDEAIVYGDKMFASSKLMDAKAYYQQALKLKPSDEYSKSQIQIIVGKMQMSMAAEDEYYDLIDLGDELLDQNKLDQAIEQFKKAIKVIPNDEYALTKIREIEEFQNNEREKIESFDKAMEAGKVYLSDGAFDKAITEFTTAAGIFPAKESPLTELSKARQQKEDFEQREERYSIKCEEAERYFLIKNYAESLALYQEATTIIPEDERAIKKINMLIPLAEKDSKFNKIIGKADEYYIAQDFINAQKEYTIANKLWPEKSYPGDMISKINEKLAGEIEDLENNYNQYIVSGDSLMITEEYSLALGKYNLALNLKPEESYPKSKISEIDAIFENQLKAFEQNYDNMVASADSAFNVGSLNIALSKYETALEVKPDDNYPKTKIAEIDKLSELLAAEQKANEEYNKLIQQGDNLYNTGSYDLAIKKYREAQALKSIESYPQEKIDVITVFLANAAKQKQIDDKYNELVLIAVQQFNQDKLAEAKKSYENALELKPDQDLPREQIAAIDSLVILRENEAETRKQFDQLLAEGDSFQESKEYDLAVQKYDLALALIPNESNAVQKKKTVITIQTNIRKEAERKKSFDEAVAKGDKLFEEGSFELSKVEFEKARSLKSDEEYPRQRLADIAKELERLEAEKEQRFAESIASGDIFFDQGRYDEALGKYQIARSIKPSENHPQQRIAECDKFIAERNALVMEDYKVAIADADKLHDAKVYDKAILAYRKAENIKPDESYPTEMIDKISRFIKENSIVDIIANADTINKDNTDKFAFEPIKINVRKSNYIFIKARNLSNKTAKLIFSYGSDGSKNGGFVVQVIEGEVYNDYIVRVGNQYKWFSEDNNWITIHPENGDVEISMLRISKGY